MSVEALSNEVEKLGLNTEGTNGVLSNEKQFPLVALPTLVAYLPHADRVSLLQCCKAWSRPVAEAMYGAPLLQSFDSFERLMTLLNTPLPAHPYPELIRELDIGSSAADNLYMGDLDATLGSCPNLEVFRLENCFHISNILVRSLAAHCPNLKQVDLPGCPISDSFIPTLSKSCRQIERLDLSFTNLTIASLHAIIINCENLIQLDLSECRPLEEDVNLDFSSKPFSRPLQLLNLRNTPVTDDLLRFTATHCPELEDIILESCMELTDDALIKVASSCQKLRRLDVSFCDNITDLSLQALAMRAAYTKKGTLEELYLAACDNITPPALHHLAQQCAKLHTLVLDGCERLMGTYVQSFATQPADDLECMLEGDAIRRFAAHVPGTNPVTPPASPSRANTTPGMTYKVQVSYATKFGESGESGNGWASTRNTQGTPDRDPAALAAAALEAARLQGPAANYTSPPVGNVVSTPYRSLSRKTSRSNLRRLSSMSLAEAYAEAEAVKQERQEKIREKRRSRSYGYSSFSMGDYDANSGESQATMVSSPTQEQAPSFPVMAQPAVTPSKEPAAVPFSSGRRRGSSVVKSDAPNWRNAVETGPTPPISPPSQADSARRPAGPVRAETAPASPAAASDVQPVLLASGRAARRAAEAAAPAQTSTLTKEGDAPVLLASGRRRSRAPLTQTTFNGDEKPAATTAYTPEPATPAQAPAPQWGVNPQAWVNPAHQVSASSAFSHKNDSISTSNGFVDPWAQPPSQPLSQPAAPLTADPWAAPPTSVQKRMSQSGAPDQWASPTRGQPTPAPASPSIRLAAATGWGALPKPPPASGANVWSPPTNSQFASPSSFQQQQQQQTRENGYFNPPQPTPTPASYFSNPHGPYPMQQDPYNAAPSQQVQRTPSITRPHQQQPQQLAPHTFTYSHPTPTRGRLLLKLKIETQTGGHQQLAVHEFDDPNQLATEFCACWDMMGFREPLVRLISVRKGNAGRQRLMMQQQQQQQQQQQGHGRGR
ncbi:uncharacterized protein EV422DRAFT_288344 [Fimicolochytrium jonesii]|uniref:uncharacterized protein n=1 Tax=Fimicolochytrium jonesii TaxID=1396493 RepID=UPI0022FEE2D9|nr:uncharacterized protein EV422DRAFT_288344 [Fimicolochytrium jonesii]KAI8816540.1 hypothetical protein EV422DRAFT_288344 [Fimicolochytrium jonesii]